MAIPPPPPPGPPPPPVPKLNLGGGGGGGGGDSRNALLLSIQKGAKLKKTVTVDKSGPAVAGRVAGSATNNSNSSSSNGEQRRAGGGVPGGGSVAANGSGGGPKLAGIFGGMSEMPKLKPVNRGANQSTLNRSPPKIAAAAAATEPQNSSSSASVSSPSSSSVNNNSNTSSNSIGNGGALDFSAELTQHLTLKKKKLQQQAQQPQSATTSTGVAGSGNVTEANLRTNRGPPPQPPPPPKNPPAPPINGISANSSSLFGNSNGSPTNSNGPAKTPPSVPRSTQVIVKIITMEPQAKQEHLLPPPPTTTTPTPPHASSVSVNSTFVKPNLSSLFGSRDGEGVSKPTTNHHNQHANQSSIGSTQPQQTQDEAQTVSGSVSEMKRLLSAAAASNGNAAAKPAPNFGKPNLAPKPPGAGIGSTPTSPSLTQPGVHGAVRATVSRHHSMKTPRSPPVAPPVPGGPVLSSQNHFGTMRAPPTQFQSQEAISSSAAPPVNSRPIGRPTVAPPRPPPNKPPPPPLRSVSNQNLPQMPLSTPTTNTLNSAASVNNVSVLKEQLRHHIGNGSGPPIGGGSTPNVEKVAATNGNGVAPPLPPHRTCPAPPPPSNASRQASNVSTASSGPPVPPQRHSSIRSVSVTDSVPAPLVVKPIGMNNGGADGVGRLSSINRIIIDLESKFADRFHNPTEFPKPVPFYKTEKHYPSLSRAKNAAAAETRKQRAPRPPARQPAPLPPLPDDCDIVGGGDENNDPEKRTNDEPGFIQLNDHKIFATGSSNC